MGAKARAIDLLGHRAIAWATASTLGGRLRIVAYHDVPDPAALRLHLQHIAEHFQIVSGSQVQHASTTGARLPRRSIWVTFDDGYPAVFEHAQPLLEEHGLTATVYVCPGLVDTTQPFWWDVAREAARHGLAAEIDGAHVPPGQIEGALKRCADTSRRSTIAALEERLEAETGPRPSRRQASTAHLQGWLAAGHEVGNHTWDHPCLDRCSDEEQRRQIGSAHRWLDEALGTSVTTFAYPNGNWAPRAETELQELGYRTAVGFDHRLASRHNHPLRLSRLRLDTDAPPARARAVIAGTHPTLMAGRDRILSGHRPDPRLLPR